MDLIRDNPFERYPPAEEQNSDSEESEEEPEPIYFEDLYTDNDEVEHPDRVEVSAPYPKVRDLRRGLKHLRIRNEPEEGQQGQAAVPMSYVAVGNVEVQELGGMDVQNPILPRYAMGISLHDHPNPEAVGTDFSAFQAEYRKLPIHESGQESLNHVEQLAQLQPDMPEVAPPDHWEVDVPFCRFPPPPVHNYRLRHVPPNRKAKKRASAGVRPAEQAGPARKPPKRRRGEGDQEEEEEEEAEEVSSDDSDEGIGEGTDSADD